MNLLCLLILSVFDASPAETCPIVQDLNVNVRSIAQAAAVQIRAYGPFGTCHKKGTGFFISTDGKLITNWHVLEGVSYAEVRTKDDKIYSIKKILAEDKETDLILVVVDVHDKKMPSLPICTEQPVIGDSVVMAASTIASGRQLYAGCILGVCEALPFDTVIRIETPVHPGASGSPVVSMEGQVIGVATYRRMIDGEWCYYAVPANRILCLNPGISMKFSEWDHGCKDDDFFKAREWYRIGLGYASKQKYTSALYYYDKAIELNPDCADYYAQSGICHEQLGRYNRAITAFTKALDIDPECAEAYSGLGIALSKAHNFEDAARAFECVKKLKPHYSEVYYNLSVIYNNLGKYRKTIKIIEQLLLLRQDIPEAYNELGLAYNNLGDYGNAITTYEHALELDPRSLDTYYGLGVAYTNLRQYTEAIGAFEYVADRKPELATVYYNLGINYGKTGQYEKEIQAYIKAISIRSDFAHAHYQLAVAYTKRDEKTAAIREYEALKQVDIDLAEQLWKLISYSKED